MASTCELRLLPADPGCTLQISGDWRLANLAEGWRQLDGLALTAPVTVDAAGLAELDTAGALALLLALSRSAGGDVVGGPGESAGGSAGVSWRGLSPAHRRLIDGAARHAAQDTAPDGRRPRGLLASVGMHAFDIARLVRGHVSFLGATASALAAVAIAPRRLRLRELTAQLEQVFVNAIPVVALVMALIGVTIAYLLGLQAEKYGANIFVVDGVGIGMAREFSPLLVAVIVAGRSGAAFTAQLGAMRMTEEIDAIRTLGLSPLQVLVVPRTLALIVALPLMVFVGDVTGVAGAMLIAEPMLGITPAAFLDRLRESLDLVHFGVGLAKAPVFALAIAVIGCGMGMTAARDTRSVGLATTSTVVQSIVSVILLDAAFAVLFQGLGW